jgi:hypothetical protein
MPWAAGSYTKGNAGTGGWTGDASLGIGIEAGRHDTQDNDFATGINQCLNKDGSNSMAADLNAGGFRVANVNAGTAAAPAICAANDVDTGIFSPAANTWAVATNGTERTRIDSTGNVGIGQTTPTRALHVGSGSAATYVKIQGSTSGTAGGSAIEIGTSGNIGNASATLGGAFDNTLMLWGNTNPISLYTSAAHRLYITSGGAVGIGTTTPSDLLQVGDAATTCSASIKGSTSGTGGGQSLIFGTSGSIGNYSRVVGGAFNNTFTFRSLGAVSLIADSGGFSMAGLTGSTGGSAMKWNTGTGAWFYDTSAARYKENIRDSSLGLQTVKALRPRQYNYIYEGKPEDVGFVAEEVEPILPYLVSKNAQGECESITYDRLTSVLVKAVQELSAQVENLEARIEALEA